METSPQSLCDQWLARLRESGYRLTGPRRAIVEIMALSQRALGPIDLFDQGRQEQPGLGLVTVYRTLEKLAELGLVQRVHDPNGCHSYLRASDAHEHLLLCINCKHAVSFSGDDLDELMQKIADRSGFEIQGHWLQLFGLCAQCQANSGKSQAP